MQGISTITQKGQVAIPKEIRDHFKIKPQDKLSFSIENNKIIIQQIPDINSMFGHISSTKPPLSKKKHKRIIKNRIIKKYANRS